MADIRQVKKIIENLKNPRAYWRKKASDELMSINDPTLIPVMSRLFSKESDFLKIQFCRFLGKIKGELAVPPLIVLLLNKTEKVAEEAALSLDKIDNDRRTEALIMILKKGNSFSKKYAIKSLGERGKIKAVSYLEKLLKDQDDELRELAIDALRKIGGPTVVRSLKKLVNDRNDKVVYLAIAALGELGDERLGPDIIKFLTHHNQHVRKAAVWALSKLGYRKGIPRLVKMLKSDPSELVREEIVRRFGIMGGEYVVKPLLLARIFDESHNVRVYADWALVDIPLEDKEKPFLEFTGEKDDVVRGQVYLELAKTGEDRFLKRLTNAFSEDESDFVKARIAEGLAFFKGAEVKGILKEALGGPGIVREKAADSLLRLVDTDDVQLALDMVQGKFADDPHIRKTGTRIIEKLYANKVAPQETLTALHYLVNTSPADIKRAIVKCLGKVGEKSTIDFLARDVEVGEESLLKEDIDTAINILKKKLL